MNTEKLLPRHPFREGSDSTKTSRTDLRKARLRAIGLGAPDSSNTAFSGIEIASAKQTEDLTDLTLIDQFVEGGLSLSDNFNLKIEAINYTSYLTTYDGITIASINLADATPFALVKRESPYWHLVNQSLLKHHYMPLSQTWQQEFIRYECQELPDGYVINFTQAGYLHQTWLQRQPTSVPLDLLLFVRSSWYPIRAIAEDQGTLAVQTLVAELTVQSADWLIWLSTPEDQGVLQAIAQTTLLDEIPAIATHNSSTVEAPIPNFQREKLDLERLPEPMVEAVAPEVQPVKLELESPAKPMLKSGQLDLVETNLEPINLPEEQSVETASTPPEPEADRPIPTGVATLAPEADLSPIQPLTLQPAVKAPQTVLSFQNGRLHIATTAGEVVVEGSDLKFWLCPMPGPTSIIP